MTPETEAELIEAWNEGYCLPPTDPYLAGLARLRAAWSTATDRERAIFKEEILRPADRRLYEVISAP
jgi:hypothetical protein